MSEQHVRVGQLLVETGAIQQAQLDQALAAQRDSGRRLGEELVRLGFLTEVQFTQILSNQLSIPWVSLYHVEFSRELLNLIPAEVADGFGLIPIYARSVRRQGDTLFVAMEDPTNRNALAAVEALVKMPVKAMVAPPSEVRSAIGVYYFNERPSAAAPPPAAALPPKEPPPAPPDPPAKSKLQAPKRKSSNPPPKMVTLTLLDGTTVKLPSKGKQAAAEPSTQLTSGDIVSALLARAKGADVSKVLPDHALDTLLATLLRLLLRKGLIADWEFIDEWHRVSEQGTAEKK